LAYGRDKIHLASRQLLVFQRVHGFPIEPLSVTVNDFDIPSIPCLSFDLSQVCYRSPLKQCRAILVHPIKPA
jgi:hypothetical protein